MNSETYTIGQRWISDAEPELGLGTLVKNDHRQVTIYFPASGESRIYAKQHAPITRVILQPGDSTESSDGWVMTVEKAVDDQGLIIYLGIDEDGSKTELKEQDLSSFLQFNRSQERLFNGIIDDNYWFELRHRTIQHQHELAKSDLTGLGGVRTELLPHQLYIAHEIGKRLAPRVLLADEVGLGKTIEACLILHRQLLHGSVNRALIVVPEPLLHQWLVELMRRFNLQFSLFDEERFQAIRESGHNENPFLAEQHVLCSLDLLTRSPDTLHHVITGEWDILIVDEAHHLEWCPDQPSPEYLAIEQLSFVTPSVLLLTATPEQLGQSGHFARLRLLDPDRYHSIDAFHQEESEYHPVATAASNLLHDKPIDAALEKSLLTILVHDHALPLIQKLQSNETDNSEREQIREHLIEMLLDRHGTGRALFRNTRDRIKGFARRELHTYPLEQPSAYEEQLSKINLQPNERLHPETVYDSNSEITWWRFDPRVKWLINKLGELKGEKVLLICAQSETAKGLEQALRKMEGIDAALFHEHKSIIERDRAAAWFADQDQGCQILICSEIGSEGRNFQFAHHLVLFDLPLNPDLLEQRIGRLDRIGQLHRVQIHVPYFTNSPQQTIMLWYKEGLDAFEHTCPAGEQILHLLSDDLDHSINNPHLKTEFDELINKTRQLNKQKNRELQEGRDHLLELNSCRMQQANMLKQSIAKSDGSKQLSQYMDDVWSAYNLEVDFHSRHSLVVRTGPHMQAEHFPGVPADGVTVTFDRASALAHEDWQFLTWEHPMVLQSMQMLLEREQGNSTAVAIKHPDLPKNSIYLELLLVLECPAPRALRANRFLPPTLVRLVMDQNGTDQGQMITAKSISEGGVSLDKNILRKSITALRPRLQTMLQKGIDSADEIRNEYIESAVSKMLDLYSSETDRIKSLQQVNPNIKPQELELLKEYQNSLQIHLRESKLRLDAIRFILSL